MDTRLRLICLCLVLCLSPLARAALTDPPHYTTTKLGDLPPPQIPLPTWGMTGRWITHAYGLNDRGQIVGESNGDAFLWENGAMHALGMYKPPTDETTHPDYPESGPPATAIALAINDNGLIVGLIDGNNGYKDEFDVSSFVYRNKKTVTYAATEAALGVNVRGELVGSTGFRGFYRSSTQSYYLNTLSASPAGNGSIATAINNKGQFVGATTVGIPQKGPHSLVRPDLPLHAFLWVGGKKNGRMKDLGALPNFSNTVATAINSRGNIIGIAGKYADGRNCVIAGQNHAVLWQNGKMIDLGQMTRTENSQALGINNSGIIVGTAGYGTSVWGYGRAENMANAADAAKQKIGYRATLWTGGKAYDLNSLLETPVSPPLTEATGINNHGQIICNNGTGAYLLTPMPKNRVGPVPGGG